jgi:hypothetical protein
MTSGRGAHRVKVSGMTWTLGRYDFIPMRRQVVAATRFLGDARHHRWLRAAAREPGIVRTLEFGLPRTKGPVQSDHLPARLLALVARFGFDIVLSHYPVEPAVPVRGDRAREAGRRRPRRKIA